jgi:putative heme-binding domain-containing protein
MARRLFLALILIGLSLPIPELARGDGLPHGDAQAEGFAPESLKRIGTLLDDAVARRQIAGGAAMVARRGKVVYLATAGRRDVEAGLPLEKSTIYRIASMTKPVTSVAAMMLLEEGKLGLEEPVSRYLPEFKAPMVLTAGNREADGKAPATIPAHREITIRDLLRHTSGLSYRFLDRPALGKLYANASVSDGLCETPGTVADNVQRLARLPLLHQPGTAWEYGLSTDVLGRVVEVVSGETLDAFFRERIFRPLKMEDTSFVVPEAKRGRLASLYAPGPDMAIRRVGSGRIEVEALVYSTTYSTLDGNSYFSGGAGLCSTIGDYARFLQMLLYRGELDGRRLLKPATVDLMTRNHIGDLQIAFPNHGDGFGFGFGVLTARGKDEVFRRARYDDVATIGTYSWGGIFDTYFWVDPTREMAGILMTQLYPSDHLRLREEFKRLTYEALSARPQTSLEEFTRFAVEHRGDAGRGRALFTDAERLSCSKCHRARGTGGEVGPDLSEVAGKFKRPQLIESVLEPSRQIVEGYRSTALALADGRVFAGIVKEEVAGKITLVDAEGHRQVVSVADVEERKTVDLSLMPEGLATRLSLQEFADLIAYLETLLPVGQGTAGTGVLGSVAVPPGFTTTSVVNGITGATAMEVAPDGRIFVCEQTGDVRVIRGGRLLEQPFVTLEVDRTWERGLIGLAIDPDFTRNGFVYVNYVMSRPYIHHRVSRFTARGDVAESGSEFVLLEGDNQSKLGGNVPAGHQGGAIHFGQDGKLYVAIGDQTAGEPAQRLDTFQGKMLRLNPDGSIPDGNPFHREAQGKYRAIWALGLRNPFTFAVQPGTGRIFINDVGNTRWEEIDEGFAGANYGWPRAEGPSPDQRFRAPIHHYPVASIAGGAFCPTDLPRGFPQRYRGMYFFMDFVRGWIKVMDPDHPEQVETFATGLARPVDLKFTPDGSLDVLLRDAWVVDGNFRPATGSLVRIRPDFAGDGPPVPPGVRVSDAILDGDMDCFKVETPTATYFYGKRGAGFAGILDKDGRDWVSYRPGGKARGEYRGLPKCGQPTKFFHCGYGYGQYASDNLFTSRVTARETGHARIESETSDGKSACAWDFYLDHATLTLLRIGQPTYWFLYEGTPGGKLDAKEDFVLRPDGKRTTLDEPWSQVVPWVCFGAAETPTGLLLINHQEPEAGEMDSYVSWPFQKDGDGSFQDMTVFGFGRKGYKELVEHVPDLKKMPARFSIGFIERAEFAASKAACEKIRTTSSEK